MSTYEERMAEKYGFFSKRHLGIEIGIAKIDTIRQYEIQEDK